ncbi:MAG TPA: chemotaxis protein CheA [Gemmatimonadales bacterium]|nr:chemotaxis protein CheA [Gemmatimonadales bacterium]
MDTAKYAALFLSDSQEHLRQCESVLAEWGRTPGDVSGVDELFRAFHTIKGMAATMGYARLAAFAHDAESLLEAVRAGRMTATPDLAALLVEVVDAVSAGVEDAVAGTDGRRLRADLQQRLAFAASVEPAGSGAEPPAPAAEPVGGPGAWISVRVRSGVVMPWARALLTLQRAEALGTVSGVTPSPALVDPERFDGRLAFRLDSAFDPGAIRAALLEVGEIAEVEVGDEGGGAPEPVQRLRQEVRVARAELDRLLTEVGELVVAGHRLAAVVDQRGDAVLESLASDLSRWTDAVHHRVLQARMAPASEVLDRFPRVVRDLARELGKSVRVELVGREIELDRSVLDAIGDPVLHLVRNALDHGLESSAERTAAGKAPEGLIRLAARRDRSAVEVVIADDGRGIDRDRVRQRLGGEALAADDDVGLLQVLARPGFSTAAAVSDVSGRGVGVNAVITRVRSLGGTLQLHTTVGEGTEFVLRLPLTLAVVPALVVTVADERYAVPLALVAETGGGVTEGREGRLVVSFRDEQLPATDLRTRLGAGGLSPEGRRPFLIVVVDTGRRALVVDQFLGRQDLVVTPLDRPLGTPAWLTGAAAMADGVPALLIDPTALLSAEAA